MLTVGRGDDGGIYSGIGSCGYIFSPVNNNKPPKRGEYGTFPQETYDVGNGHTNPRNLSAVSGSKARLNSH